MNAHHDAPSWLVELRPAVFRYCSRLLGSVIDGEDATQESLAKALQAVQEEREIERPREWLFRIAHNVSMDWLRSRAARREVPLALDPTWAAPGSADVRVHVRSGLAVFLALPETERAAVLMKDVFDLRTEEIADALGVPVSSVQNWIHRGRAHLRELASAHDLPPADARLLQQFADRFNAGNWEGVRELLAHDVQVKLVGAAATQPGTYLGNYARQRDLRADVAMVEGRLGVVLRRHETDHLDSVLLLECAAGRIVVVRDYRHAPHVLEALKGG